VGEIKRVPVKNLTWAKERQKLNLTIVRIGENEGVKGNEGGTSSFSVQIMYTSEAKTGRRLKDFLLSVEERGGT